MSPFALPLVAALLLAAPPKPPVVLDAPTAGVKAGAKVIEVEDPLCPGGTTLETETWGTDLRKFCQRTSGAREGPFIKIYTPTGTLQEKGSYHAGKLHGPWSKWDTKAVLREQGDFHEGNKRGWWATFHANGKKASTGEYGDFNQRRGTWTTWNDKGQVIEEGEYREGQKHGFWITYDPKSGKVKKEAEYANGVERRR